MSYPKTLMQNFVLSIVIKIPCVRLCVCWHVVCFALFCLSDKTYADEFARGNNEAYSSVAKWVDNLDSLKMIKFTASFVDWAEYANGTRTEDNQQFRDWVIDFHTKRFWKGSFKQNGIAGTEKYGSEVVVTDKKILSVSKYVFEDQIEFGVVSFVSANNNDLWEKTLGLLYWGFPFGYIEGTERIFLPDVLSSAELEFSNENGRPKIHATTSEFITMVEFDSEECQFVQSLEMTRIADRDKPFALLEVKYIVNRAEKYNGVYLPVDYYAEEKYNGGKISRRRDSIEEDNNEILPRTLKARIKLENIVLPENLSDEDFKIMLDIPNYTPAFMQDAPQIEHIWLDGKIVPKTNEAMLAIARGGHKFMPGPESPRFWFMAIGIILILIGGGRLAYKYIRGEATL